MSDLVSSNNNREYLVIGWFTPNYKPLADKFAANLDQYNIPYHLFAKPAQREWNTRRKPEVVLEAVQLYKGKTLILMDIDCIVRGDIERITKINRDVGITLLAQNIPKKRYKLQHWIAVEASSRVVVFKPTQGAKHFAAKWRDVIAESTFNHDEHSLIWAFLQSASTVSFSYIDRDYSGREITQNPDGIIVHNSAHHKVYKRWKLKDMLRGLEKPFRSGRRAKEKQYLTG